MDGRYIYDELERMTTVMYAAQNAFSLAVVRTVEERWSDDSIVKLRLSEQAQRAAIDKVQHLRMVIQEMETGKQK